MNRETQVTDQEQIIPAGEAVSPEPAETTIEGPAPSDEHDQEIADLQAAIDTADSPEEKAAQQKKLNTAFARLRREAKDSKAEALQAIKDAHYQKGLAEARKPEVKPAEAKHEPAYVMPEFTKPAPREADFEDYADYQVAREEYIGERAEHRAYHRAKADIAQDQADRERKRATEEVARWKGKGAEKFPDFLEVAQPDTIMLTEAMRMTIWKSEMSHEIAYFLGGNPKEYKRIYEIDDPYLQAAAIGKIEDRLKNKPAAKTVTAAPNPIKPVTASGPTEVSDDKLNDEAWIAKERERLKKLGRLY